MTTRGDRIAVGTRLVRKGGALTAVVVVKATFQIVPGAVMKLADPKPIQPTDKFRADDPRRSLLASSDLAPELPCGEITFVGTAHSATPVKVRAVRLALTRGQRPLVDKTLHVYGERLEGVTDPTPFTSVPLVYERAYGGPGFHDNPCGVGAPSLTKVQAQIVYPEAVRAAVPAGFGPIAASNASRKRLLGAGAEAGLGAQTMDYDERTPAAFFCAAPPDQRVERLVGDEWITMVGLSDSHEVVDAALPSATARATITPKEGAALALPLQLDTVQIDGASFVSLLFRGAWTLPSDAVLAGLTLTGALALPDGSLHERAAPPLPAKAPPPRRAAAAPGTVMLDAAGGVDSKRTVPLGIDAAAVSSRPATPFPDSGRAPSSKPAPPIAGAPWNAEVAPAAPPVRAGMSTLAPDDEAPLGTRATLAISLDALTPPTASAPLVAPAPAAAPQLGSPPSRAAPASVKPDRKPDEPVYRNLPVQEQPIAAPRPVAPTTPARPKPPDLRSKLYPSR
ncbi:MAG: DUF2169 domain-containing protein [Polyangiaceae bacterium]